MFISHTLPTLPTIHSTETASAIRLDADSPAEIVTCTYDMPCFVSDGLQHASDAVNFWTTEHSTDITAADSDFQNRGHLPTEAQMRLDLHLFRPENDTTHAGNLTTNAALIDVLSHTVGEMHTLAADQRGHYLAQLLTRWFSDGTLAWQRFRIANLLATYYSMMPANGAHLGALDTTDDDLTVFGWSTVHGEVLDVVHVFRQMDGFVEQDIATALAFGKNRWPASFIGIRYLPLGDLTDARFYRLDASWDPVIERDLLHLL